MERSSLFKRFPRIEETPSFDVRLQELTPFNTSRPPLLLCLIIGPLPVAVTQSLAVFVATCVCYVVIVVAHLFLTTGDLIGRATQSSG